jgi:hypothetical protein
MRICPCRIGVVDNEGFIIHKFLTHYNSRISNSISIEWKLVYKE